MKLNTLKPVARKMKKRKGRGMGSGLGKTCGRGHKGQTSRSGYSRKTGFEGGQMPLQRRIPKLGFRSRMAKTRAEVRLHELAMIDAKEITLKTLIDAGIVPANTEKAKVIASGKLEKAVNLKGVHATRGAKAAIEKAGGSVEEVADGKS